MRWKKKGILFSPMNQVTWAVHSALQPTPLIINDKYCRIYCGMRDDEGISRIGYVNIMKKGNELVVDSVSGKPVLDIGLPGTFDDNGVVPSAIVRNDGKIWMYYAGYQLVKKVRFLVLCGLAISEDDGLTFRRLKHTPILERTSDEFLFRVIHTIMRDNGKWKVWYGGGNYFQSHQNKTLPVYDIRYMESSDGINFPQKGSTVLSNGHAEHRVGRPYVIKRNEKYFMFFGASTPEIPYRLAYAISENGLDWKREEDIGLTYHQNDFDSGMSAYPSIIELEGKTYMIYNGNEYGKYGFGYAELEEGSLL